MDLEGLFPRVRGTISMSSSSIDASGLSPRVRGNRAGIVRRHAGHGSIPARAGEPPLRQIQNRIKMVYPRACGGTNEKSGMETWHRVYPRACGGTEGRLQVNKDFMGLSPRVRGNHFPHPPGLSGVGSIPARAGEPDLYIRE